MTFAAKEKTGYLLIALMAIASVLLLLQQGPVSQDLSYHLFADTDRFLNIPNFWNVASNLPYLFIGIAGLYQLLVSRSLIILKGTGIAYFFLFSGVMLVAFGSGYYHLAPDNQSLVWDRLPMTIAFMALFSIIISEFVSVRAGRLLFPLLLLAGIASVIIWHLSEQQGQGDLRFYAVIQFFPMLVIPVILLCFRSRCSHVAAYWILLAAYLAAKLLEYFDASVFQIPGLISGHSIKHLVSALGLYVLLLALTRRSCSAQR